MSSYEQPDKTGQSPATVSLPVENRLPWRWLWGVGWLDSCLGLPGSRELSSALSASPLHKSSHCSLLPCRTMPASP